MRPFVAGAGGFLGRSIVRAFARAGHTAVGLVHSPSQAAPVTAEGGTPVVGDLLEPSTFDSAIAGCDVAIHVAQPSQGDLSAMRRVRVEGCRRLVRALRTARVPRLLVGSGYWVYADNPGEISESSPLAPMSLSKVNFDAEMVARRAAERGGLEVVVLRPGMVYGNGSWFREMVQELVAGAYRYVGTGSNAMSPIHWSDAGDAFRAICERWHPGETYLATDDSPVSVREFAEFVAEAVDAPSPKGIPLEVARRTWGRELAQLNAASRAASNAKVKRLGWRPVFPHHRDGVRSVLSEMRPVSGGPNR